MAFHTLDARNVLPIVDARQNIAMYVEIFGDTPPVYFSNRHLLDSWTRQHNKLVIEEINQDSFLRISGEISGIYQVFTPSPGRRVLGEDYVVKTIGKSGYATTRFEQFWARANYSNYRDAIIDAYLKSGYLKNRKDFDGIDIDHIENRNSIPDDIKDKAWIGLFPVPLSANRGFGSKIEKNRPEIQEDKRHLSPLVVLKLYCGTFPKSRSDAELAMHDIRGQWQGGNENVDNFLSRLEDELLSLFPN